MQSLFLTLMNPVYYILMLFEAQNPISSSFDLSCIHRFFFVWVWRKHKHVTDNLLNADFTFKTSDPSICNWRVHYSNLPLLCTQGHLHIQTQFTSCFPDWFWSLQFSACFLMKRLWSFYSNYKFHDLTFTFLTKLNQGLCDHPYF